MDTLAALVEAEHAERAIASLREEGVYDEARSVRARDDDTVELPVTAAPTETAVNEVVHQADPSRRGADLEVLLLDRGWTESELAHAPGSWSVVGDVVLVRLPDACPRPEEVGEALLELQG
ncbi:MAG: class I SAM-dependent methyltransferase family protein, partial [Halobacteriales archaeon]|nr:class I SAM-dependent methyltransferase family protein [Halobacteriales archaeon]